MTGSIPTPTGFENWERRVQITWIAPAEQFEEVSGAEMTTPLRSNLVVSTSRSTHEAPEGAARAFWDETSKAVPGLERVDEAPFVFDDALGYRIVVEFYATPDVRLRQTHLFRIDDAVLTQFVLTVDAETRSREEEMLRTAATLQPPA